MGWVEEMIPFSAHIDGILVTIRDNLANMPLELVGLVRLSKRLRYAYKPGPQGTSILWGREMILKPHVH